MTQNNRCNICFEDEVETKTCFHRCTHESCDKCISKWIKIVNKQPVFECPQCKRGCTYIESEKITDNISSNDKDFSEFCKNVPCILDGIIQKYKNENSFNFGSVINFQTDDPMTQAESQSDFANILRHFPNLLNPSSSTTQSNTRATTQSNTRATTQSNTHATTQSNSRATPPIRHENRYSWRTPEHQRQNIHEMRSIYYDNSIMLRRNRFHEMIENGVFD
jgi:hypothetical protein